MAKKTEEKIIENTNITEEIQNGLQENKKEEIIQETEPTKKYKVKKDYTFYHRGIKYFGGQDIELTDNERKSIKYGIE